MKHDPLFRFLLFTALAIAFQGAMRAEEPVYQRAKDVIYGRKYGVALTMDVFTPAKPNGAAVVWVVSGGWYSSHDSIKAEIISDFLVHGYTVFAVVHGSQPKFTIPEILADLHRAIRFIRHHASDYGIDPQRIGITGGSAGGHLSLMQGTAGTAGDASAADPVEQESSRVQAVACLFPPSDFLNYGAPGESALGRGKLKDFPAPFDFHELQAKPPRFVPVTDEKEAVKIGQQISPVTHVSSDDPPTLIIHGDADELVPLQQAQVIIDKLRASGVDAKLIVKPGAGHGWPNMTDDIAHFSDWFDEHLAAGN